MTQSAAPAEHSQAALAQLARHGKTFNWARRLLGHDMGLAAAQLYAFCRHVDDIADGDMAGGQPHLDKIAACLRGESAPPDSETAHFIALAKQHKIDLRAAHSLLLGLLFDQGEVALETEDELLVYAYRVAGTVGLMMAPILQCSTSDAHRHAIDLGIAMQLTNIARDVAEDAAMGRRYIPADWCGGASSQAIDHAVKDDTSQTRPELQRAIARLLDLADSYYASGFRGLAALPLRAHISMAVAGYCYRQIGVKLRARNHAYWQGRVVVGWFGKLAASLRSLATLRLRGVDTAAHKSELHQAIIGELYEQRRA